MNLTTPHRSTATLTVAETADELRVSTRTVYNLLASGELKSLKIGRSRRILRSTVDAYLAALERKGA